MGMFKDVREMMRMGNEMKKTYPMPSTRESISQLRGAMEQAQTRASSTSFK